MEYPSAVAFCGELACQYYEQGNHQLQQVRMPPHRLGCKLNRRGGKGEGEGRSASTNTLGGRAHCASKNGRSRKRQGNFDPTRVLQDLQINGCCGRRSVHRGIRSACRGSTTCGFRRPFVGFSLTVLDANRPSTGVKTPSTGLQNGGRLKRGTNSWEAGVIGLHGCLSRTNVVHGIDEGFDGPVAVTCSKPRNHPTNTRNNRSTHTQTKEPTRAKSRHT